MTSKNTKRTLGRSTGVLAVVVLLVISSSVALAGSVLVSLDTGSEFQSTAQDVVTSNGMSVNYTQDGMVLEIAASGNGQYITQNITDNITSNITSVTYNMSTSDSTNTTADVTVFDAVTNTTVATKSVNWSDGTATIDISEAISSVYVNISVDNVETLSNTITVRSLSVSGNTAPTADFVDSDNSTTVSVGENVTLDASASSDPDGDALTYSWDLNNDGTFGDATGATVAVSESSNGTYNYTAQVSDGLATDTATFTLDVTDSTSSGSGLVGDSTLFGIPLLYWIFGVVALGGLLVLLSEE